MDILAERYVEILRFIESYDRKYDFETLCTRFSREDLIYLNSKYIKSSYNVMTLQPDGRNYLAKLDHENHDKYATKQENRQSRNVAVWALVISGISILTQVLIELLRNS